MAGTFNTQEVANTLWANATMGRDPGEGLMRDLEGRGGGGGHVQRAGCGKHAVGICEDGAGVMRGLEGRAKAVAGTFNAQTVGSWPPCTARE